MEALEAAREAGNDGLVAQAERRLTDLGMPPVAGAAPTPEDVDGTGRRRVRAYARCQPRKARTRASS